jgi:hypothetical protein
VYNSFVPTKFTVGDVIRKARTRARLSQTDLGERAANFIIDGKNAGRINKSTVSKVEKDPYSSEFGTVWRLIATLGLTLADVESDAAPPFVEKSQGEGHAPVRKRRQA